jgi:hypothetical protein
MLSVVKVLRVCVQACEQAPRGHSTLREQPRDEIGQRNVFLPGVQKQNQRFYHGGEKKKKIRHS